VFAVITEEARSNPALDAESGGVGGVSRLLAAGVYRFNFAHNLPSSLPSSFESHVDHSRRRVAHQHQQQQQQLQQQQQQQQRKQQQRKQEQRIKVQFISSQFTSSSSWPYLSSDLVRSEREYC